MDPQELQDIILRNSSEIADIRRQVGELTSKEKRAETALRDLKRRVEGYLAGFDRDKYKSTDQRLLLESLANEVLIFAHLGYDLGTNDSQFLLGIAAFLDGRNQAAVDHFTEYLRLADPGERNVRHAHYLAAMICYNRRDFNRAVEFFESAYRYSPEDSRDWQSAIYVGELLFFLRRPREVIEKQFGEVAEALKRMESSSQINLLLATLYLKWGNVYVGAFLEPKEQNPWVNNSVAAAYYKQARKFCPKRVESGSLLPVVIDNSLAQALLLAKSLDMDLSQTPSELVADVFQRLRRIVLTKREEIILAQSYFMLGTCAFYSSHVSKDVGEIYLEYARHQTLSVPSDVCFYSCITKELLSRDEFVKQIDYYAHELERQSHPEVTSMFGRREIKVPPGAEAVLNGKLDERTLLTCGLRDSIYFVRFAPHFATVSTDTACREGVRHKITAVVRLEIQRADFAKRIQSWGHSDYSHILTVSADEIAKGQNLIEGVKAIIQTFGQNTEFFALRDKEAVRKQLDDRIRSECAKAGLVGDVVSCDVTPPTELSQAEEAILAAKPDTASIASFFRAIRQQTENARADDERLKVENQQKIEVTKTNFKITQLEEENRFSQREEELRAQEAERQKAAQERNAAIKESAAEYEFKYKTRRIQEEMQLAKAQVDIAKLKDDEESTTRERKKKDMVLELKRARILARIRSDEKVRLLEQLGGVIEKVKEMPVASYEGVHTLITSSPGMDSKDLVKDMVFGLFGRLMEGFGAEKDTVLGGHKDELH